MPRTCVNCRFALLEDYGYSNYTTEGTEFHCLKGLHPDGSFDQFYGEHSALQFAEKCDAFSEGEPVELDVENELRASDKRLSDFYTQDPEVAPLLDAWEES
jgi:hypothetical protein